jgi:hypothetical protein
VTMLAEGAYPARSGFKISERAWFHPDSTHIPGRSRG